MKRVLLLSLLIGLSLPARGELPLTTPAVHALTRIDRLPSKEELLVIFPTNAVAELTTLATDSGTDFGVRLRAIRALAQFCAPMTCAATPPHTSLINLLASAAGGSGDGKALLLLRAIIESIGVARSGDVLDVARLTPFLDHHSRDIRAATALALRDLCRAEAETPLRNRYQIELGADGKAQVRVAISAALRDLAVCVN